MDLSTPGILFSTAVLRWRRDPPPVSWTDKRKENGHQRRREMRNECTKNTRLEDRCNSCLCDQPCKKNKEVSKGLDAPFVPTPALCPWDSIFPLGLVCFSHLFLFLFVFLRALFLGSVKYLSLTAQTLCRGVCPVRRHVDLGLVQPIE